MSIVSNIDDLPPGSLLTVFALTTSLYLGGLVAYRLFLGPLARFPEEDIGLRLSRCINNMVSSSISFCWSGDSYDFRPNCQNQPVGAARE
jgi:hypothetical protein